MPHSRSQQQRGDFLRFFGANLLCHAQETQAGAERCRPAAHGFSQAAPDVSVSSYQHKLCGLFFLCAFAVSAFGRRVCRRAALSKPRRLQFVIPEGRRGERKQLVLGAMRLSVVNAELCRGDDCVGSASPAAFRFIDGAWLLGKRMAFCPPLSASQVPR